MLKQLLCRLVSSFAGPRKGAKLGGELMAQALARLTETDAAQIMTPRHKLRVMADNTPLAQAFAHGAEKGALFLVVAKQKTDELLGVAYMGELAGEIYHSAADKTLADVVRKPLFVPESRQLLELFADMNAKRGGVAFVVDEAGQINGALSREGLIAFAVEAMASKRAQGEIIEDGNGSIRVGAATSLAEIEKQYGKFTDKSERKRCDTVGGLVALLAGHIPATGEVVRHRKGIEFQVVETVANRITQVRIIFPPE